MHTVPRKVADRGPVRVRVASSIDLVPEVLRPRTLVAPRPKTAIDHPTIPVEQFTLRPGGLAPLDAMIATPAQSRGILVYVPGFNTPMGPWEMVKCQHLAQVSHLTVVMTEIPGMSRFKAPIPKPIRKQMLAGSIDSWSKLNLTYLAEAIRLGRIDNLDSIQVLGFSTGCSLAASALPELAGWGRLDALNLVEPVAITRRNLAALQAHNLADLGRMPAALATNLRHSWLRTAWQQQQREPSVHYTPIDLLAIASVLATEGLLQELRDVEVSRCSLVRGERSSLCRVTDFEALDQLLTDRGVPGPTITASGLGHQLWHSFPMIAELTRLMLADAS